MRSVSNPPPSVQSRKHPPRRVSVFPWYHATPVGESPIPGPAGPQEGQTNDAPNIWTHLRPAHQALCQDPGVTTVVSHNVRSAGGKVLHLQQLLRLYDAAAIQEANIPESQIRAYSRLLREASQQVRYGDTEHLGEEAARQARILTATRADRVMLDLQLHDPDLLMLQRSGRWKETAHFMDVGQHFFIVANFYGLPDTSSSASAKHANEAMLRKAILRASSIRNAPYFLIGDLNVDPSTSTAIRTWAANRLIFDLPIDWGHRNPTFTHATGGVHPTMQGPGTSRIDTVLANTAGAERTLGIWYDWEISRTFDHTAIVVAIQGGSYQQCGKQILSPPKLDFHTLAGLGADYKNELWPAIWELYAPDSDHAILAGDIDGADRIWSSAAVAYLANATGNPHYQNRGIRRGGAPKFADGHASTGPSRTWRRPARRHPH